MTARARHAAGIRLVGLASYLLRKDQLDRAERLLELAERLAPRLVRLRVELGRLAILRGDAERAIAELDRAREMDPFDEQLADLLARLQEQRGETDAALACLADAEILVASVDDDLRAEYRSRMLALLPGADAEKTAAVEALLARRGERLDELAAAAEEEGGALAAAVGGGTGQLETALARTDVLSWLDEDQRRRLLSVLEPLDMDAGECIFREGQPSEDLYFVQSGEVAIQRETPFGPQELGTVGAGELFGEINFIDGLSRSADAVAASECRLLRLSHVGLSDLFAADHRLAVAFLREFWRGLSDKIRVGNELLKSFFPEGGAPPAAAGDPADEPAAGADGPGGSAEGGRPALAAETGKKAGVDAAEKAGVLDEKGLTGEQLRALAALAEARTFDADESVFREGDVGESLYVVLDGKVRIQKHIPGVGDEALAILERGDFFGEMAIVDRAPRSASAVAHDPDTTVLRFSRKHVDRLLEEDVEAGRAFLEVLCRILSRRLREINDRIVQWRYLSGGF